MGHLSWNCAPTSCRHVITHTLLILLLCSCTVPRRPAPGCKELRQPHTNCAAVDNSSCLQVEEQFVRPRPLHVAQPHRHPHRSRTRPGHCGPPLTTAGVRQRGCSPSDGVSAMTRGAVHEITGKGPHTSQLRLLSPHAPHAKSNSTANRHPALNPCSLRCRVPPELPLPCREACTCCRAPSRSVSFSCPAAQPHSPMPKSSIRTAPSRQAERSRLPVGLVREGAGG